MRNWRAQNTETTCYEYVFCIGLDWIVQCFTSPPLHSIGYMGDGF